MYLCYIDESGTPEVPGNTSHFVLAGISIPISKWRDADRELSSVLGRYGLENAEFHTAWMLRTYLEQSKIAGFADMDWAARRTSVRRYRTSELLRLQKGNSKAYKQAKKNYAHTDAYSHLTMDERRRVVFDVAAAISNWRFARLFAECIDKVHFDPQRTQRTVGEQAFEQVISRFQHYLSNSQKESERNYGLVVHDNNQSVAKKHTALMRSFHVKGTLWTTIDNIIETPLFVDSSLTRMVQVAVLCAYALRRFVENAETEIFKPIFQRADRFAGRTAGVRHFAGLTCACAICSAHTRAL